MIDSENFDGQVHKELDALRRRNRELEQIVQMQVVKAWQASENFATTVANVMPTMLYIYDFEINKNIWVNNYHRNFFKDAVAKDSEDITFNDLAIIIHPDDFPDMIADTQQLLHDPSRRYIRHEIRFKKNNHWRWMEHTIAPFKRNDNGTVIQVLGSLSDITERKQAEQDSRRDRRLLNDTQALSKVGGWEYDVATAQMYWTNELYNLHELDPDSTIDHMAESLNCYQPDDREIIKTAFKKCVRQGIGYDLEFPIITFKGNHRWIRTKTQPLYEDGKVVKVIGSVMDITDQKEAQMITDFVSTSILEMVDYTNIKDIHRFVARKLYELLGKTAFITIVDFDNQQGTWAMSEIEGISPVIHKITRLLGFDLTKMSGKVSTEEGIITSSTLQKLDFNMERLTDGYISRNAGESLKKMLFLKDIYTIAFAQSGSTYGNVSIITTSKTKPLNKPLIEAFISQVSTFIRKMHTEQALKESEEKYRFLTEATAELICLHAPDGKYLYLSPSVKNLLGYEEAELIGVNPYTMFHPDDRERIRQESHKMALSGQNVQGTEYRIRKKNGRYIWFDTFTDVILDGRGQVKNLITRSRNVTDRKQAEESLHEALEEKEILLKEIHHRVKNNLQTISSILYLQQQHNDNEAVQAILTESINRIKSMALIHEQIYQTESLAKINLADYISDFAGKLFKTYKQKDKAVTLHVQVADIHLTIDNSIPLALILNELITNSLKYAFPGQKTGRIEIEATKKINRITLAVRDNGVGLPDDFDIETTTSLGLYLVYTLVTNQLDGELKINKRNPTEFMAIFAV